MGFFEAYSSKTDVPPAPPKTDRGYFLPPKRVFNPSSTSLQDPSKPKAPLEKKGKLARKSARQLTFGESRLLAAQAVVNALGDLGLNCAIFGSMACHLLGSPRLPNDVDILVLQPDTSMTQEEIKEKIIQHQPDYFFLHSARDPSATYRILHYRPTPDISSASKSIVKVDILLPGIMHLPFLTPTDITIRSGLPIIPYPVLLLQKLQAWDDHRLSEEERYRKKLPVDAKDVIWLLAPSNWEKMGPASWNDRRFFEEGFEKLSRARVIAFCMAYPTTSELWSRLGFTTY
ncbi:hypothetical protein H0H93_002209 [Arthromyces matolae]|nr:hypothetical protein H0H93_002209 [Arthromyces matolae]